MDQSDPIVIVSAARTPMGGFQGDLSPLTASQLGGAAINAALSRGGVDPSAVDEVVMGCVLPAGQGQAPARQAGFAGGLADSVPATTVNKMCGSGMKATMQGCDQLLCGDARVVVTGGMESMSNAPYLLPAMRGGARLGHGQTQDHMFLDGLEDAYEPGRLMGSFAEDCAEHYQFSRQDQDGYALESLDNALRAQTEGDFDREICAVTVRTRKAENTIDRDEQPAKASPDKIPLLKPAFKPDGSVTAANASSISDGAAALVLMRESEARAAGLSVRARILSRASHAQAPGWFTTAPVPAAQRALDRAKLAVSDIGLFEVNKAFAVVPMAFMREFGVGRERVNVNGGACALGHPIGASGARILVTLLHAMEHRDQELGLAAICIGGGEGAAVVLQRA